jgi:predicted glycoside hydrolase/deacetylase ChbG (UPF0249 family)
MDRGCLIISADDVGHNAHATDRALECFEASRITSASAMVYMEDSDRASATLRGAGIPVGLHINLSEAFTDAATPPDVRSRQARLLPRCGPDGARRAMRWLYKPRIRADVERCICIDEQLQRFRVLYGGPPTHVDGHQHVHLCPNVSLMSPRMGGGAPEPSAGVLRRSRGVGFPQREEALPSHPRARRADLPADGVARG